MAEMKEKTAAEETKSSAEEEVTSLEAQEGAETEPANASGDSKKDKDEKKTAKKGGIKALLRQRKMRHGSLAVVLTAVAVAVVILINVVTGLLLDRFPEMKADFTANKAFALSSDTKDYMSRLTKDLKLYIISDEKTFTESSNYFVQAKNLLDKMVSCSNGKFTVEFVDTTENPQFTQSYPNIDWTAKDTVGVLVCGEQYKGLGVKECFTYDEEYYNYYGMYKWTGTTIEQAVVKAALNVTADEKVIVDVLTGEGESSENGYEGVTKLLNDNAYQVNEVSLLTGELDKDARMVILFAPLTDLSDKSAETLSAWLDNDGKYGRTLIYVANADPTAGELNTPNIDALLKDWGMELNKGIVYETDLNHCLNNAPIYTFITDYTNYYVENLKNKTVPVVNEYACGVTIKDENTAHAILQTSDQAGVLPYDAKSDYDLKGNVTGTPIAVAAEGVKTGTEKSSNVIVFSSKAMLLSGELNYPSFNNGTFFMNIVNTVAGKEDNTVIIEGKSLDNATLGAPSTEASNSVMIVFMFVIPALILVLGIVLWIRRRNR